MSCVVLPQTAAATDKAAFFHALSEPTTMMPEGCTTDIENTYPEPPTTNMMRALGLYISKEITMVCAKYPLFEALDSDPLT